MTISGQTTEWEPRYAHRAQRMVASEIRELLKVLERPNIISFAGGIPDPALFPVAEIGAAYADVLSDPTSAGAGLQYSVSEGYAPLRQWIARDMRRLGVPCAPDNIVITNRLAASPGVPGPAAASPRAIRRWSGCPPISGPSRLSPPTSRATTSFAPNRETGRRTPTG